MLARSKSTHTNGTWRPMCCKPLLVTVVSLVDDRHEVKWCDALYSKSLCSLLQNLHTSVREVALLQGTQQFYTRTAETSVYLRQRKLRHACVALRDAHYTKLKTTEWLQILYPEKATIRHDCICLETCALRNAVSYNGFLTWLFI